ncbi:MAG: hypothetical protein K5739_07820 [Lachnospiraceae bacterium]|nr:hypothetical protein [Lachnospiraceae bacterium]
MINHIIKAVFVIIFVSAWLALCFGKYNKWNKKRKHCTREMTVKVTDILERKTARGGMTYKPIFQPVDEGDAGEIDSAYYSNLVSFEVGQTVTLLVNPDNPKEFLYKDNSLNRGMIVDVLACVLPPVVILVFFLTRKHP